MTRRALAPRASAALKSTRMLPDAFLAEALKSDDHKDELSSLFNEYAGKEVRYEIISYNKEVSFDRQYADLLKILHVEKINIED